jgi:hypothetical protein
MNTLKQLFFILFISISGGAFACITNKADTVNVYEVYRYIKCSGILYPDIVLRQAIWETGWFKSKHTLQKNNLFGFRYSKKYMSFDNWMACVDYYKSWQLRKYTNPDEDYYKFLIRIKYATSQKYISSLKSLKIEIPEVNCDEE